ncbi:hypothetical protein PV10_07860 [Exophiala mesophila]|uniref:Methyltransferase type 11 domain-containing protein n=1 Tax=Exophiala mesophila TaxID=212818 RepID=A0A0D1Z6Y4_EXOME|nr:uncharacterized protein PV10_07860 [Exophiala mesophila]KIV90572.1 hypothetical protein PV10_07860 [Exophiala mesophila]
MTTAQVVHQEEETFRNFDSKAATDYAKFRPGWDDEFIANLVSRHTSQGGKTDVLLDLGCGPGTSTRTLATHFQRVIALDPSPAMIEVARGIPSKTALGESVQYEVGKAESLSANPFIKGLTQAGDGLESVDVITAATAAHWFDLDAFWIEAAKVLKPGGSVIFFASGESHIDPNTTPNAAKYQQLIDLFQETVLVPYEAPGNRLTRELYKNLRMPWDVAEANPDLQPVLSVFKRQNSVRQEIDKSGQLAKGEKFVRGGRADFNTIKLILGTASPIVRWRQAHQEQLEKGEIEDCVDEFFRKAREILDETEEGRGRDYIDTGLSIVILVVRKDK